MSKGASTNQLLFLEQYFTQEAIEETIGVSPRYQRLIKEGKRSGAKYADAIKALYDMIRKTPEPPKKRRRPARKRPSADFVYVPDMLNVLFSIFEPRTFKAPKSRYQVRDTLALVDQQREPAGKFNTWFVFFITFGMIPPGDKTFNRYKRVFVPDEDDEEEREEMEPDSIHAFYDAISRLSEREYALIEHLNLLDAIEKAGENITHNVPLFVNFWISRVTTVPVEPENAAYQLEDIAQQSIDIANNESDDVYNVLVKMYGFFGFNVKK